MTSIHAKNGHVAQAQLMPHDLEAEESLVGAMVIDPDCIYTLPEVTPDMFYCTRPRVIFEAIKKLAEEKQTTDFVIISAQLRRTGDDDLIDYVLEYSRKVPNSLHAQEYAKIVKDNHVRRKLIREAGAIATAAYDQETAVSEIVGGAQEKIIAVSNTVTDDRAAVARENVHDFLDYLQSDQPIGLSTGYLDLDRCIGGLEPGSGYWFGAAEKVGKTSFMNGISLHNALKGNVVVRFSLEMSKRQRTRRDIANMSRIPVNKLKARDLTGDEMNRAMTCAGQLAETTLIIDDTPGISPAHIRAVCNRILMQYGSLALIEVDYFQLMSADKPTNNRVADLEEISRQLVQIQKEFHVPLIGASQVLSKSIDHRQEKRPQLSDMFGSSALQKDAYFIGMIYRDEYYHPETTDSPGIGEIVVRAHRDGDTPVIKVHFDAPCASFRNLSHSEVLK